MSQSHQNGHGPRHTEAKPMTGATMVWEALVHEGVDVIFGHPGGAILPTYDALAPYEADGRIHHVLVRHEQCAAHMADGYARATGRVGVCIATSGPGATNLVTGLATALMDSVPVVAITGQVPTNLLGTDAFQESDVVGVMQPVCKHTYLVTDVRELPMIMKEAFYIAREGRPGPVLVDICKDVQNAKGNFSYDMEIDLPGFEPWPNVDMEEVRRAAELINRSERPLIICGHGVQMAGVARELLELVEKAEIPVVTTLLGTGNIPESHPLSLGMGGMHGEAYANRAVQGCDLLIAMGMRFDDRITGRLDRFAKQAKVIHFELDQAEIGKNVVPDVPVVGDLGETLPALLPLIEQRRHQLWIQQLDEWRSDSSSSDILNYEVDELIPPFVIRQLWHYTKEMSNGPVIIVTDVGQHQMWESQYYIHDHPGHLHAMPADDQRALAAVDQLGSAAHFLHVHIRPRLEAIGRGDVEELDHFANRFADDDLKQPMTNGMTLMQLAVESQQPSSAEWLITHGLMLDALAAWDLGWKDRATQVLFDHPEQANQPHGELGITLLHIAVQRGDVELAKLVLSANPDLNQKDQVYQSTPLGWARHFHREEIIRLIEEQRAGQ